LSAAGKAANDLGGRNRGVGARQWMGIDGSLAGYECSVWVCGVSIDRQGWFPHHPHPVEIKGFGGGGGLGRIEVGDWWMVGMGCEGCG
jgi:hypothetical protein